VFSDGNGAIGVGFARFSDGSSSILGRSWRYNRLWAHPELPYAMSISNLHSLKISEDRAGLGIETSTLNLDREAARLRTRWQSFTLHRAVVAR